MVDLAEPWDVVALGPEGQLLGLTGPPDFFWAQEDV